MDFHFKKVQPGSLRLWHWLTAFAISGLLLTVLLRKTVLSWRTNAELIQRMAGDLGAPGLTADGAASIARALRDPMWQWHYRLGFALAGLLVFRLVLGFRNRDFAVVRELAKFVKLPAPEKKRGAHYMLVKTGYAAFYCAILFMAGTGLSLYFKAELGLAKGLASTLKEAHELTMWLVAAFVAGHLAGVVLSELRGEKGLVSDMINGGEQPPRA